MRALTLLKVLALGEVLPFFEIGGLALKRGLLGLGFTILFKLPSAEE